MIDSCRAAGLDYGEGGEMAKTVTILMTMVLASAVLADTNDPAVKLSPSTTSSPPGGRIYAGLAVHVGLDSIFFKRWDVRDTFYGCPKSQVPNPVPARCRTGFSFLDVTTRVGMDPAGTYVYEVNGSSLRRHSTSDGTFTDYTISNGGSCCMTDGSFLYVPVDNVVYKYTLTGTLASQTTLDITPLQWVFSVANDTVWCGTAASTLNGYACAKFTGGALTPDATWNLGAGDGSGVLVGWDGNYYYAAWNGHTNATFKRFDAARTLVDSGTISLDVRGVLCKSVAPLMIVTTDSTSSAAELAETLAVASGGVLDNTGTRDIRTNAAFPANEWYDAGCRVVLEFSGSWVPANPAFVGESLAEFVDLGGRVVTAMWADNTGNLAGRYVTQYMPFTIQPQPSIGGAMAVVHDPLHPIMDGVTALAVNDYMTGNTHSTLRSPNCVCLAEWDSQNRSVVAYLDSADVRLASIGFVPLKTRSGASGQWARLLANAIRWVWPGTPNVSVTAPANGNVWDVGSSHDITWTAANGPTVRDSIVYTYDNGATWQFVDQYTGARTSYNWNPIPNTPDTSCYVRVFSWNASGQASGTSGRFQIRAAGGTAEPAEKTGSGFVLQPVSPNPAPSGAWIRYILPRPARVRLGIYDVSGALVRRLADDVQTARDHSVYWNGLDAGGRRVAPGVYYCRLRADGSVESEKLIIQR
jgi:hypothetical protein